MASFEREEANELRSKADKKLKGFNLFGSRARRLEEAAELYERAAAKYRVSKHCRSYLESIITRLLPQLLYISCTSILSKSEIQL